MRTKFTGWSFGASKQKREQTVAVEGKVPADPSIPGPGTYTVVPDDFGRNARKYTIRPRTVSPGSRYAGSRHSTEVPGPGTYQPKVDISKTGFYFPSHIPSSRAPKISPSSRQSTFYSVSLTPGPGAYDPKTQISKTGDYYLSSYRSSQSRTFGREKRRTHANTRAGTPGPGSYRLPSDFGFYERGSRMNNTHSTSFESSKGTTHIFPSTPQSPQGPSSRAKKRKASTPGAGPW